MIYNMKYTDAHCHILTPPHNEVVCCACDATNEDDWEKVINNSNSENVFACIGIHPWYINSIRNGWESRLYETLVQNPTVMVGEVGIDKHKPDIETQIKVFADQLEIAAKLKRPLHLHCVGAWDKILHIFKTRGNHMPPTILAHRFCDNPQIIEQIADKYNVYFSYSMESTPDIIRATPITRILTESDTFDVQKQIQNIITAINNIAEITQSEPNEISEQIYENFQRMVSYVRPIE